MFTQSKKELFDMVCRGLQGLSQRYDTPCKRMIWLKCYVLGGFLKLPIITMYLSACVFVNGLTYQILSIFWTLAFSFKVVNRELMYHALKFSTFYVKYKFFGQRGLYDITLS